MRTLYLHGAPGSPSEPALFGPAPDAWFAPDRFLQHPGLGFGRYMDALTGEIEAWASGDGLRLVGFSAGARIALEIAARLPASVTRLELISPAAPFELGDFTPRMEGRHVFALARRAPALFSAVGWGMARVVDRIDPHRLFDLAFAHPAGEDAELVADPAFAMAVGNLLRRAMGEGARGYRREILACVRPWRLALSTISAPARIWQGTADNWTPPDMAAALAAALPGAEPVRWLDGRSHYSALRFALKAIASDPL